MKVLCTSAALLNALCSRDREAEAGFLQPLLSQGACAQLQRDLGGHETCQPRHHPNSDSPDLRLHLCGAPALCWGLQEPFKTPCGRFALSLSLKASPQSHPRELRGHRIQAVTQGRASPGTRQGLRGLYTLVWPCRGRLLAVGAGSHSHGHARAGHSPLCATHTSKWRVCACRCVLRAPQGWWREPVPALAPRAALHCRPGWLLGSVSP